MNVQITFRHMDHTPALDSLIREKSQKFEKWLGANSTVNWVCWVDGPDQCSEVKVLVGPKEYFAKAATNDLYKTVDLVIQKIHNQME